MLLVTYWGCLWKKNLTALVKEGSVSLRSWEGSQLKRRVIWHAVWLQCMGELQLDLSKDLWYFELCDLYLFLGKRIVKSHALFMCWSHNGCSKFVCMLTVSLCFSVGVLQEFLAWLWLRHLPPLEPVPKDCWFGYGGHSHSEIIPWLNDQSEVRFFLLI